MNRRQFLKSIVVVATVPVISVKLPVLQPDPASVLLGQAIADGIVSGVKSLHELSRIGVIFTGQQKAMIEAMVELGDVVGAQKIILAELDKEFGDLDPTIGAGGEFGRLSGLTSSHLVKWNGDAWSNLTPIPNT